MSAQGWLVGGLVALATWHMVRSGLRWLRRVRAGGSACGGCSGAGCATACGTAGSSQPVAVQWHPAPSRAPEEARRTV